MCLYMWVFCLLEWLCGGGDSDHCAVQARASGDTGECLRKRGVRVLKYSPLLTPLAPGHSVKSLRSEEGRVLEDSHPSFPQTLPCVPTSSGLSRTVIRVSFLLSTETMPLNTSLSTEPSNCAPEATE